MEFSWKYKRGISDVLSSKTFMLHNIFNNRFRESYSENKLLFLIKFIKWRLFEATNSRESH